MSGPATRRLLPGCSRRNVLRARGCSASLVLDAVIAVLHLKIIATQQRLDDLRTELTALESQRTPGADATWSERRETS